MVSLVKRCQLISRIFRKIFISVCCSLSVLVDHVRDLSNIIGSYGHEDGIINQDSCILLTHIPIQKADEVIAFQRSKCVVQGRLIELLLPDLQAQVLFLNIAHIDHHIRERELPLLFVIEDAEDQELLEVTFVQADGGSGEQWNLPDGDSGGQAPRG